MATFLLADLLSGDLSSGVAAASRPVNAPHASSVQKTWGTVAQKFVFMVVIIQELPPTFLSSRSSISPQSDETLCCHEYNKGKNLYRVRNRTSRKVENRRLAAQTVLRKTNCHLLSGPLHESDGFSLRKRSALAGFERLKSGRSFVPIEESNGFTAIADLQFGKDTVLKFMHHGLCCVEIAGNLFIKQSCRQSVQNGPFAFGQ